jgi:hypothetical protein
VAVPELLAPGMRTGLTELYVAPSHDVSVRSPDRLNAGMLVLPIITTPTSISRCARTEFSIGNRLVPPAPAYV